MTQAFRPAAAAALLALAAGAAGAQPPVCSSDGQPAPAAVLERFISADCEGCWTDVKAPEPAAGELALDWIVPGRQGEAAPLAAAARREGLERLQALRRSIPRHDAARRATLRGRPMPLRVAHGLPFNGYVGASIQWPGGAAGRWRAWLLLVEAVPAGAERSPVARHVVRNVLRLTWDGSAGGFEEARPMNIPEGARPDRLRVVGLLEDARGRIRGIAQSRCAPPGRPG